MSLVESLGIVASCLPEELSWLVVFTTCIQLADYECGFVVRVVGACFFHLLLLLHRLEVAHESILRWFKAVLSWRSADGRRLNGDVLVNAGFIQTL